MDYGYGFWVNVARFTCVMWSPERQRQIDEKTGIGERENMTWKLLIENSIQ